MPSGPPAKDRPRAEIWWITHSPDVVPRSVDVILPYTAQSVAAVTATTFDIVYNLDKDREFLTRGGVFSNEWIDSFIDLKMEEVNKLRMTTHPVEFELYYSC